MQAAMNIQINVRKQIMWWTVLVIKALKMDFTQEMIPYAQRNANTK